MLVAWEGKHLRLFGFASLVLTFLILLPGASLPLASDDDAADEEVTRRARLLGARNAVESRDFPRAIARFRGYLEANPDDVEVTVEFAGVLAQAGETKAALQVCDQALSHEPTHTAALTLKASLLASLTRYKEALAIVTQLRKTVPEDRQLLRLEADLKAGMGELQAALEIYRELVKASPQDSSLLVPYLRLLAWAEAWDEVLKVFKEHQELIPVDDEIRLILVQAHVAQEEVEQALKTYKAMDPQSSFAKDAALRIADYLLTVQELEKAALLLEDATRGDEPDPNLIAKRAVVLAYLQMPKTAFQLLKHLPAKERESHSVILATAEILLVCGRYHDCLEVAKPLMERKDTRVATSLLSAQALFALEREAEAAKLLSTVLASPETLSEFQHNSALTERALCRLNLGQYESALSDADALQERLADEDPTPALLRLMVYRAPRQLSDYDEAALALTTPLQELSVPVRMVRVSLLDEVPLAAWHRAHTAAPENTTVALRLAGAELTTSNFGEARELYQALSEQYPTEAKPLVGLLRCAVGEGKLQEADELADSLLAQPLSSEEALSCATILLRADLRDRARALLDKVSPELQSNLDASSLWIVLLLNEGKDQEAHKMVGPLEPADTFRLAVLQALLVRLADFDQGLGLPSYDFARSLLEELLSANPTDSDLRYSYGRILAGHKDYELAEGVFKPLHDKDPNDARILRWFAWLTSWTRRYQEAEGWYGRYRELRPHDVAARRELARLAGWQLDYPEANRRYQELARDFPEDADIKLEWQAKRYHWQGRYHKALGYYREYSGRVSGDTEMLFECAQMYHHLDFTFKAQEAYEGLLNTSPSHHRGIFADGSAEWRGHPRAVGTVSYTNQEGRGRDFDIARLRLNLDYTFPRFVDAMELALGLGESFFFFDKHGSSSAEHLTLEWEKAFLNSLRLWVNSELTHYNQNSHYTTQLDAEVSYRFDDLVEAALILGREDVLENFITLRDRLAAYYLGTRGAWDISRRVGIDGLYRHLWYNDDNQGTELLANVSYKASLYPRILKFILAGYHFETRGREPDYWTPSSYSKLGLGIHWRHYLGSEHYAGAPLLYYGIGTGFYFDNESDFPLTGKLEFAWDSRRHWAVGAEVSALASKEYDEQRAMIFAKYRF